jgi:hypothetical protein
MPGVRVHSPTVERSTTTSEDGRYRLERRASDPGSVELRASAEGMVEDRIQLDFARGMARLDGNDFHMLPPLVIEGHLEDDSGRALAGVRVWAYEGLGGGRIAGTGESSATEEDGHFLILDATAGEWSLWPNLGERMREFDVPQNGFQVQGGDRNVRIVLASKAPATGSLEVEVVDAALGKALDPVSAWLYSVGEQSMIPRPVLSPGKVNFEKLIPGRYDLWVATASRRIAQATFEVDGATPRTFGRLEVGDPGRVVGSVEASATSVLPAPPKDRSERRLVVGQRLSESGIQAGGGAFEGGSARWFQAEVDEAGHFVAENLMPGPWSLELQAAGLHADEVEIEIAPGGEQEVRFEPQPAAVVEFLPERIPGNGWMIVELMNMHDEWEQVGMSHLREGGHFFASPVTVLPGKTRWRVKFQDGHGPSAASLAAPQEGEIDVAVGERHTVDLRVEPVDF